MKILYDSQIFYLQKFGGISRYFYKLANNNLKLFDYVITGKYSENIYVQEISSLKPFPIKQKFKGKGIIENYINRKDTKRQLLMEKYDIYHPTYYYIDYYPKNKPVIITVHDFIHELFPEYYVNHPEIVKAKQNALSKADRIIAISNSTKNDLLSLYPSIREDKIDVIHHAVEWNLRDKHPLSVNIDRPYILFTGQRNGYKNFDMFIHAIAPLLLKFDLNLFCTGVPFNKQELNLLYNEKIDNHVCVSFVEERELQSIYENALCFVFPSKYEGFGFPILEAFASRCPVALSNASCFPEIAQDAALYFNPDDIFDIRETVEKMIISDSLRREMIIKGEKRLKDFSFNNMINKTINAYKKMV